VVDTRAATKLAHITKLLTLWEPIVLIQKKDGMWILCIDYQPLNKIIFSNRYLIPWINDLVNQLKGVKYFNMIYLKS